MQYVDLSVAINEQTPVYPGDPLPKITPELMLKKDGCSDHMVTFGTHFGTHMDAPSHMLEGGKTLDQYPVDYFVGPGKLIKVEGAITTDMVVAADIKAGDIVLFWTGMSEKYADPEYFEAYPVIPEDVSQYLANKRVKIVGVDTCSVDGEAFVSHRMLLKNDVLIIENLANLKDLEGKQFTVYALPIKLQLDGAPARVIALVD